MCITVTIMGVGLLTHFIHHLPFCSNWWCCEKATTARARWCEVNGCPDWAEHFISENFVYSWCNIFTDVGHNEAERMKRSIDCWPLSHVFCLMSHHRWFTLNLGKLHLNLQSLYPKLMNFDDTQILCFEWSIDLSTFSLRCLARMYS